MIQRRCSEPGCRNSGGGGEGQGEHGAKAATTRAPCLFFSAGFGALLKPEEFILLKEPCFSWRK